MKKLFITTLAVALIALSQGAQLVFAQDTFTRLSEIPPELTQDTDEYEVEVVENPDGSYEIIHKYKIFNQFKIPVEVFERDNLWYEDPILDDEYIVSPFELSRDPEVYGSNALLAILIFLVVGIACFLFNNVIEAHGDSINKFANKIPILNLFQGDKIYKRSFIKKLFLLFILLLFGLIAAHISPDFNLFEQKNLGILIVTVVSIIVATYAKDTWRLVIASREGWPAFFKPNLLGLLLAIFCVFISRKLEIPPGYLFGIPMGLFIFSKGFEKNEGKFEFSALWWMFFMAILFWFAAPFVQDYETIFDLTNLLYVILLEGVFFELFPITFLPGKAIYKWSKVAWAFIFGTVSFLILQTLFNPNSTLASIKDQPPAMNTLIILGAFVIFSFVVWGIAKLTAAKKK